MLWRYTIIPWVECLLAIRFACGSPRLYQFAYPMPVRSVSIRGRLFVSFGLFVFCFPVSFMVSLLFASFGVRLSFSRVLLCGTALPFRGAAPGIALSKGYGVAEAWL